jgi:formate dehydrogenase assembly factor FdhD
MLKWFLHRKLRAFERGQGYDASYMHEVLDADTEAFMKFARATSLGRYQKDVPTEVRVAAGLTSSIAADCGPCTQLGVGFALAAGVSAETVAAIVRGDETAMSRDVALGVRSRGRCWRGTRRRTNAGRRSCGAGGRGRSCRWRTR